MNPLAISLLVFALISGGAIAGIVLLAILRQDHLSDRRATIHARAAIPMLALLALSGCAVTGEGPSIVALPGPGKNVEMFRADDAACRQFSAEHIAVTPGAAANQSFIGSMALATALGAAEGALIGTAVGSPGAGAAIGAASGLGLGTAWGLVSAQRISTTLQASYDDAYAQCMWASGETVPQITNGYSPYPGGAYFYQPAAMPYPYYYTTWVRYPATLQYQFQATQ
jgi:hypothetical protein